MGSRAELLSLFRPWLLIVPWSLISSLMQFAMMSYSAATGRPSWTFVFVFVALLPVLYAMGWAVRKISKKPRPFRLPWFKPFFMRREHDGALNPFQYIWRFLIAIGLPFGIWMEMTLIVQALAEGPVDWSGLGLTSVFIALFLSPIAFMFWEESRRRARDKETQAE